MYSSICSNSIRRNAQGMKTLDEKEQLELLKNFTYVSIISADNDEFGLSEDDKQEIIYRHKLGSSWDYILEPIKDEKQRKTLIEFFESDE